MSTFMNVRLCVIFKEINDKKKYNKKSLKNDKNARKLNIFEQQNINTRSQSVKQRNVCNLYKKGF